MRSIRHHSNSLSPHNTHIRLQEASFSATLTKEMMLFESNSCTQKEIKLPSSVAGQFDDSPNDNSLQEICSSLIPSIISAPSRNHCCSPHRAAVNNQEEEARQIQKQTEVDAADETQSSTSSSDGGFGEKDVLCGRGGKSNNHFGNREFRRLIDLNRPEYFTARKPRKTEISRAIVDTVRAGGGRFLKFDKSSQTWEDIGDVKAVEKTSQALREGAAQKFRDILSASGNVGERKPTSARVMTPSSSPTTKTFVIGRDTSISSPVPIAPSMPLPVSGDETLPEFGVSRYMPPKSYALTNKRWIDESSIARESTAVAGPLAKRRCL